MVCSIPNWLHVLLAPAPWDGILPPARDMVWMLATMTWPRCQCSRWVAFAVCSPSDRARIVVGSSLAALAGVSLIALVLFALKNPDWSQLFIFSFGVLSALGLQHLSPDPAPLFHAAAQCGRLCQECTPDWRPPRRGLAGASFRRQYFDDRVPAPRLFSRHGCGWRARRPVARCYQWCIACCGSAQYYARRPYGDAHCANRVKLEMPNLPCMGKPTDLGDLLIHRQIHEVIAFAPVIIVVGSSKSCKICDYLGVLLRIVRAPLLAGRRTLQTLYPFAALNLPAVVLAPPHLDSGAALFVNTSWILSLQAWRSSSCRRSSLW